MNPTPGSPRLQARIAGFLYLLVIVFGCYGLMGNSAMIVRGDAAATAANILRSETHYRLCLAAEIAAGIAYVGVTALLYRLLKPAGSTLSLVAAAFSLAGCAVGAAVSTVLLLPLILLGGQPYLSVFSQEQLQALALAALRLHGQGYSVCMVFFGVYCILLGVLVLRSAFTPRFIGVLLAIAGAGYLINSFSLYLSPALSAQISSYAMAPGLLAEGGLTVWLLLCGVNAEKWRDQAAAGR